MRIISDRHLNLHSASTPGGLFHLPKRVARNAPDDVQDDPSFDLLRKNAVISVLKDTQEVTEDSVEENLEELEEEAEANEEDKED